MSNSTDVSEQLKEIKDEKKVKRKKSVKLSEGKSKSSTSRKSSDVSNATEENNGEIVQSENGATESEEKSKEIIRDDFLDRKTNESKISGHDVAKNESKNAIEGDEDSVQKSGDRKTITLRELDFRKLAELKEAFHLFDINRDGYIDKEDLRFTFTSMGKPNVTEEALDQMLREMSSSSVDFDTFVKLFGYKAVELDSEEELLAALSNWDYLGTGMISEERLKRDLQAWGDKFSAKEAEWALEEAPLYKKDGTTMIDYVKFCNDLCALRNVQKTRQIEKEAEAYEKDIRSFVK